ncbi:heterokaryon incompatibility protein-domain-containing protein [Xylaria arbuscula]|nr:heterokaryon incompatibility protein-domain-containing protein [Xylaria arbuscula]
MDSDLVFAISCALLVLTIGSLMVFSSDLADRWIDPNILQSYELYHQQLDEYIVMLNTIRREICVRDDRFSYIHLAMQELLRGDFSIPARRKKVSDIMTQLSHRRGEPTPDAEEMVRNSMAGHPRHYYHEEVATRDIISSTVFELLSVFDIDITTEQAEVGPELESLFPLANELNRLSKDMIPKPTQSTITPDKRNATPGKAQIFQYYLKIHRKREQVRVVELLDGAGDDPIRCRLKLCDVHGGGINEALSYVWGTADSKRNITVSQQSYPDQPFTVTENLYDILRGLRHPHCIRTIWIDAICIDQSNPEERNHQVRLMRYIYSHAQRVIIWLGTDKTSDVDHQQDNHPSLPRRGFGNTTMHEYDLVSITKEYQECLKEPRLTVKRVALQLMLYYCMSKIFQHKWWGRIWTLQEGALPKNAPTIIFQGHQFSFDHIISGIQLISQASPIDSKELQEIVNNTEIDQEAEGGRQVLSNLRTMEPRHVCVPLEPLLAVWRRRKSLQQEFCIVESCLQILLERTAGFQSKEPRDKIFALESLQPRYAGILTCVDYNEDDATVFKRITARCFNTSHGLRLVSKFPFYFESITFEEKISCPSWVLDYGISRAVGSFTENFADNHSLDNLILKRGDRYQEHLAHNLFAPLLATPKTLFCTGAFVDSICTTGMVDEDKQQDDQCDQLNYLSAEIDAGRQRILLWAAVLKSLNPSNREKIRSDKPCIFVSDRTPPYDDPMQEYLTNPESDRSMTESTKDRVKQQFRDLVLSFFLTDDPEIPYSSEDIRRMVTIRYRNIIGKTYFITGKGLVGIATAPVQEGDILVLLHEAPLYFVLRETDAQLGDAKGEQKHRIVARAAVRDEDINIEKWFASLPRQHFRIV